MPTRSKIDVLPKEVWDELERRITKRAFSGYEELAGWLATARLPNRRAQRAVVREQAFSQE